MTGATDSYGRMATSRCTIRLSADLEGVALPDTKFAMAVMNAGKTVRKTTTARRSCRVDPTLRVERISLPGIDARARSYIFE